MLDESKPYMVRAEGLTKNFQLYANQTDKLKSTFMGNRAEANFWALRGLSFEIQAGDVVGIVGTNGSGKSTKGYGQRLMPCPPTAVLLCGHGKYCWQKMKMIISGTFRACDLILKLSMLKLQI